MGEVWKATAHGPAGFEKLVAIKTVLPYKSADPSFVEMFVAEAKLVAQLVHPNIVQVYDFGLEEGPEESVDRNYFLVMEYVAGQNLARLRGQLKRRGMRLPIEVCLYIGVEAAKSLAFAHSATDQSRNPLNIVHRDVSGQNILVSFSGEVKVADFGIARVARIMPQTVHGMVKGKNSYLSPEQAQNIELDGRSDIFSLGIVLWELLTGEKLFTGDHRADFVKKIANFPGLQGEELERIPVAVREIIQTAMAPDREERYSNATQMEADLMRILGTNNIIEARSALGSIVQNCFPMEFEAEVADSDDATSEVSEVSIRSETGSVGGGIAAELMRDARGHEGESADDTDVSTRKKTRVGIEIDLGMPDVVPDAVPGVVPPVASPPWERSVEPAPRTPNRFVIAVGYLLMLVLGVLVGRTALVSGLGRNSPPVSSVELAASSATEDASPTPTATRTPTPVATLRRIVRRTPRPAPTRVAMRRTTPTAAASVSPVATRAATRTPVPQASSTPTPVSTTQDTPEDDITASPEPSVVATPFGTLSVNARPWAEVWIDGERVAATPLLNYHLAPGSYDFTFTHPEFDLVRASKVKVTAGGQVQLLVDLTTGKVEYR